MPFWLAYSNGANSIEADVYLLRDTLFVTHAREEIVPGRTLRSLYLDELDRLARRGTLRDVQLLIDVKSEAYATLDRLVGEIGEYPALTGSGKVGFVVSGNRPAPADYGNYPDHIAFDHQNLDDLDAVDLDRVAMISRSFTDYSHWNGYGRLTAGDLAKVEDVLQRAAATGKPFRFWATPDTKTGWATFAALGVGYVNTDRPAAARAFLDRLRQDTYAAADPVEVYAPANDFVDGQRPRNVILMIGDGNGLAQISAARNANGGQLNLTGVRHIGLVGTASADDPVTDSAAGGTAMATGTKTNNRAIGVDPAGEPLTSLAARLGAAGYVTGIITTDGIDGATPSAFYAHTPERDDSETIIGDLVTSNLDFFIAGGRGKEARIAERFATTELAGFTLTNGPVAVYNGESKMPSVRDGRGAFLAGSLDTVLHALGSQDRPFFLLVEGAQIDSGGHANDLETVITEMLDFDGAVGRALRFVDDERETLVVVTADHETGGLGVATAAPDGGVRGEFLSVDHTGSLVPLFSYGPGAETFTGVMENTAVCERILDALGQNDN